MEMKPWTCKNGHVMGQVRRDTSRVRQLLLYRNAIDSSAYSNPPQSPLEGGGEKLCFPEVDIIAVIEGYAAEVRCSECGAVRTWVPGQEALDRLIRQVKEMRGVV